VGEGRLVRTGGAIVLAGPGTVPPVVADWLAGFARTVEYVATPDELLALALRARPVAAVLDARDGQRERALAACERLKRDSFTGIVPTVVLCDDTVSARDQALDAGADEVITAGTDEDEGRARLTAVMRRSGRDTDVHPTTRLPGTTEIEAELGRRIASGEVFATCYADLDHFKEFNDRYGYNEGDRVIRVLALVLHDAVKGACGERGFVGHIGGDDFIFIVPLEYQAETCETVVETFEALVPFQYTEADRRAGYYFGKDRRGHLHRVPLMSVSIGVVTNERRRFTRAAQVSELASEMKSYAKAQPGSVYAVDRRTDVDPAPSPARLTERSEGVS
jgi:diguanylate cyclase (GGDEF)-like protein